MTDTPRRTRLTQRVAWAGALSAALGGLLASSVGGYAAHGWLEHGENRELSRITAELADEILEEMNEAPDDDSPDERRHFAEVHGERTLANILVHELEDVGLREPRAVIRDARGDVVGDAALPDPAPGKCVSVTRPHPLRACGSQLEDKRLVLAKSTAEEADRQAGFLGSVALGALVAALFGGMISWLVARWALGPLDALRRYVRAVRPDEPRLGALAHETEHIETEELRQAVADLIERLSAALDQARAFASHAAHELRTPLATLAGEVELLRERQPELAELGAVQHRLQGLTELVQRLLILTAPSADLHHVGRAVDLSDLMQDVVTGLGAPSHRVEVHTIEDPVVRGDEQLLRVMVENALGNALKFSAGSADDRVRVEIEARDQHIVVRVIDAGIGMTASDRERASVAFYRSPAVRASGIEGHGIGVALIRHVAHAHGGDMRFPPVAHGTVIELDLPRFEATA